MDYDETALDKAMRLQNGLVAEATGGTFDSGEYIELRRLFLRRADLMPKLPSFVKQCSDTGQFWSFIKHKIAGYQPRRVFLWDQFKPLIDYLEAQDRTPGVAPITEALEAFDPEGVH